MVCKSAFALVLPLAFSSFSSGTLGCRHRVEAFLRDLGSNI